MITITKRKYVGDMQLKDVLATLDMINNYQESYGIEAYLDDCHMVVSFKYGIEKLRV